MESGPLRCLVSGHYVSTGRHYHPDMLYLWEQKLGFMTHNTLGHNKVEILELKRQTKPEPPKDDTFSGSIFYSGSICLRNVNKNSSSWTKPHKNIPAYFMVIVLFSHVVLEPPSSPELHWP